jgi:hypothetical protein
MCVVALEDASDLSYEKYKGYDFILVHPFIVVRYNDVVQ